jgi:hypothetical protein
MVGHQDIASIQAHAEECLQRSELAATPLDRDAWLLVAAGWIDLAMDLTFPDLFPEEEA